MKLFCNILIILSVFLTTSCGEDRSIEFRNLTADTHWIEETMQKEYLWNEYLPELKFNDYFADPSAFLDKIVYKKAMNGKGDSFSYIEEIGDSAVSRLHIQASSYGLDYDIFQDPLGTTTHLFAKVIRVLPNTPAYFAGLKRGNWISQINGERISTQNHLLLVNGNGVTVSLVQPGEITDEEGQQQMVWEELADITLSASIPVENNPFALDSLYHINGKRIAYLHYLQFSTGPTDELDDTRYSEQMERIFAKFKNQQPDEFILDLRYNTGGYIVCAQQLASLLAPATALGNVFCTMEYNATHEPQKSSVPLDSKYAPVNLDLKRIIVLTNNWTASASELIINCLRPYMQVIQIGTTTVGKPVGMTAYTNETGTLRLWPVTCTVYNAQGNADYVSGLVPDINKDENSILSPIYEIGDTREFMLHAALQYLLDVSNDDSSEKSSIKASFSSMSRTSWPELVINNK